ISAEAAQIGRHRRQAQRDAFHRRVAPRLVVAGENAHVAAAHELLVIEADDRAGRADELRMENHLYRIVGGVEKMPMAEVPKHWVTAIVDQIVRHDQRLAMRSPGMKRALESHL